MRKIMRKLFIAVFMFVSSFGSNVMADGHSIKMGIIGVDAGIAGDTVSGCHLWLTELGWREWGLDHQLSSALGARRGRRCEARGSTCARILAP